MRENKFKHFAITGLIIFSILFLIMFSYYYVFISPKMIEAKKVEATLQQFELKNEKDVEFKSRYFLEDIYFSASDDKSLYLFDEEGTLYEELLLENIDEERINTLASVRFEDYAIAYVIVDKKPTYVIVTSKEDVFVDIETFEEILVFRKGITND